MSRPERLLLLAFFAVVLILLGRAELPATVVGGLAAAVVGAGLAGRLKRLSGRMDARLGIVEDVPRGVRPVRLAIRAGMLVLVLGVLLLTTVVVPFVGDELFAAGAAAVTAFAAVLTAWRLRA